jgi:hypothetical protein
MLETVVSPWLGEIPGTGKYPMLASFQFAIVELTVVTARIIATVCVTSGCMRTPGRLGQQIQYNFESVLLMLVSKWREHSFNVRRCHPCLEYM